MATRSAAAQESAARDVKSFMKDLASGAEIAAIPMTDKIAWLSPGEVSIGIND